MDDIVDRLRDRTAAQRQGGEKINHVLRRLNIQRSEAANEIERLRNKVSFLESQAQAALELELSRVIPVPLKGGKTDG